MSHATAEFGRAYRLPTIAHSVRERNLGAEPWLTMTVTEGDRGLRHVVVLAEGQASIVPTDDVRAVYIAGPGPDPLHTRACAYAADADWLVRNASTATLSSKHSPNSHCTPSD